ncbi:MAG: hypothetical protein GX339_02375 [Tissierellia bacterium]|nr:hypothetical protein [Tissierellia bacterium]
MNRKITIIISIALVAFVGILVLTMMKDANQVSFSATVLENNQTSILVEPFEGEDELRSSDKIVVRVPGASNQLEDLSEFRPGEPARFFMTLAN